MNPRVQIFRSATMVNTNDPVYKKPKTYSELDIDYDAIMKSIKLGIEKPQIKAGSFFKEQGSTALQANESIIQAREQGNNNRKSEVFDSVVFDDLSRSSCFDSLVRAQNNSRSQQSTHSNYQFQQLNFAPKSQSEEQQGTPKPFKRLKPITPNNCHYEPNKQNHQNTTNMQEPLRNRQSEHRYLSHTETSQKKVNKKIAVLPWRPSEGKSTEKPKLRRENSKKPGIEIIKARHYQI